MKKWINNISKKFNFTHTETELFIFLIAALIAGVIIKFYISTKNSSDYLEFDYSVQDSLFFAAAGNSDAEDTTKTEEKIEVASKKEVSDFDGAKKSKSKSQLNSGVVKKVNINTANLETLITLPGIGEKTAKSIIEYRIKNGSFKKPSDLLNVKGIGKSKLEKINSFLIYDK